MNKNLTAIKKITCKPGFWRNLLIWGLIFSIITFFIARDHNPTGLAIVAGLIVWIAFALVLFLANLDEYFAEKKITDRLRSDRYAVLHKAGFEISKDQYLKGAYNDYHIRIYLKERVIEKKKFSKDKVIIFEFIEVFYTASEDIIEDIGYKSGDYDFGDISFDNNNAAIMLPAESKNPDFDYLLENFTKILNSYKLFPITEEEWEDTYGGIEDRKEKDVQNRTVQLIKIGKILDIKYTKPDN